MSTVRIFSLVVLSLTMLAGCGPGKYVPTANEELYGTWINKDNYGGTLRPQKEVITANGVKKYSQMADSVPFEEYTKVIDSRWKDSEGNIWYKTSGVVTAGSYKGLIWQGLDKLSKSGTVWESVFNSVGMGAKTEPKFYPTKIDQKDETYRIMYRSAN